jgi:hypothetical protein
MDRAATLPCPMMVVGVVMDAAPPNQSEQHLRLSWKPARRKVAFAYFRGKPGLRTAVNLTTQGKLQQIAKMPEFVGAKAKPNLTVLVHRR